MGPLDHDESKNFKTATTEQFIEDQRLLNMELCVVAGHTPMKMTLDANRVSVKEPLNFRARIGAQG